MSAPLVSILVPAYNAERWIAESVTSALDQTWPHKEIIIVDDGSTDDTFAAASVFSGKNVSVVRQENAGAAAARNHALGAAQGEFIQWLDADDLLDPHKIARQMRVACELSAPRVLLSSPWGRFYYRQTKAKLCPSPLWFDLSPSEWMTRKLEGNLYMIIESWLVSRELADSAGPWNTQLSADDDGEYFCRVIHAADRIAFVPRAFSYYRASGSQSLSGVTLSRAKLDSQFQSIRTHIETLLSLADNKRTRAACISFLQRWLIHFYPEQLDIVEEATKIALALGGSLSPPILPRKYDVVRRSFGWGPAKKAMFTLPNLRTGFNRRCDALLFLAEGMRSDPRRKSTSRSPQ